MATTIFSDIQWATDLAQAAVQPSERMRDWLESPQSLTARLRQHTASFHVEVLSHQPAEVAVDERALMQLGATDACQCREVILGNGDSAWVFARSIIPQATQGLLYDLQHIGDSPLGEALFNHPNIYSGAFEFAHFPLQSKVVELDQQRGATAQPLWGRRRVFMVEQQPVLVAEVFLSAAPSYGD